MEKDLDNAKVQVTVLTQHKPYWLGKKETLEEYLPKLKQIGEGGESYWKKRCLLAEKCLEVSPCDPDITKEQIEAHEAWQQLKSSIGEETNKTDNHE
jgi:hypothetical protein